MSQAEFQQAEQDVINRIGSKMVAVLEKYANANGFAVVLDVSNPQTSPVLWATQGTVITKELVDAYDKENPAGRLLPRPSRPVRQNRRLPVQRQLLLVRQQLLRHRRNRNCS